MWNHISCWLVFLIIPVSNFSQMRLVDDNGKIVPIGKQGEVQVKSHSVIKSYHKYLEKTREAITEDGFFKTG